MRIAALLGYTRSMCGIAGFYGENRVKIERMTAALAHRGPDGNAILVANGASLGHARLAILDPSPVGDQPMWNEEKTAVIVYNGEIYNYRELRISENLDCRTGTDTEVLLKLYEKYGMDFVKLLRGMFAFGIYDVRKKEWHLARDSSGIKPLFITYFEHKLHFASEIRSLVTSLAAKPALNYRSLSQYLRLQYVPGPETMYEGVESLAPGTILTWSEQGEKRYSFSVKIPSVHYASPQEFSEHFPAVMDKAVKDHLISDRPVGIFLSGGMDSSILLHHMCNHAQKPVKTFTVRFEAAQEEDEKRFNMDAVIAKQTAQHYGTDHHEIVLTAELCRDIYRNTARSLDQPNADSVAMAQFVLAREAKKHVDVVLSGSGGDELFGGYPRYRIAKILHALRWLPDRARSFGGAAFGFPSDVLSMQPGPELAERLLARPTNELLSLIAGDWFDPKATTQLFEQKFDELKEYDVLRAFMEFDRKLWLVDESLRLSDAVTMASGLECRVPFLDPLVIAASHGTASDWHVGFRTTKKLLKETYYPILPHSVRSIKKASFYPPLAKWFRRECGELMEETIAHPTMQKLFKMDIVEQIFTRHKNHQQYALHTLSTLTQLRCWLETIHEGKI